MIYVNICSTVHVNAEIFHITTLHCFSSSRGNFRWPSLLVTLAHSNESSSAMSIPQEIVLNVPSAYKNASAQLHESTGTSSILGKPKFNPKALKEMSYHVGKVPYA
jgi:hypothetical protein